MADSATNSSLISGGMIHDSKECLKLKPKKSILNNQTSVDDVHAHLAQASGDKNGAESDRLVKYRKVKNKGHYFFTKDEGGGPLFFTRCRAEMAVRAAKARPGPQIN